MANNTLTAICNAAVNHIKKGVSFSDIDTDVGSLPELVRTIAYDTADALVEMHNWNFAITTATLAPDTESPAYGYDNRFQLPTDWLKTLHIVDTNGYDVDYWNQKGKFIECNESAIILKYLKRITDYTEAPSLFIKSFEYLIAVELAEPLTRSAEVEQSMMEKFKFYYKLAIASDSQQAAQPIDYDSDSDWLSSRSGNIRRLRWRA